MVSTRFVEALGTLDLPVQKCFRIGKEACLIDSKIGLKKYISVGGKWRFIPALCKNGSHALTQSYSTVNRLSIEVRGLFTWTRGKAASASSPPAARGSGGARCIALQDFGQGAARRARRGESGAGWPRQHHRRSPHLLGMKGTKAMAIFKSYKRDMC